MKKKQKILTGLGILIFLLVSYFGFEHWTYVSTDNAQISAHVTLLSSRVNGTIESVNANENQRVKAGDVLAQIDTADYSNASEAAVAEASGLAARTQEAEENYHRARSLFAEQAISRERFDAAKAAFSDLSAKLKAARAQADQAHLNVTYTKIVAPVDGVIARKSVELGQFVTTGQALFGFVADSERWVTANLKETQLSGVSIGRKVSVEVDAISGSSYEGEVESIGPATGALFSLLPPDNATGNFTKVVQRVPVKIKLLGLNQEKIDALKAGLSAVVWIRRR